MLFVIPKVHIFINRLFLGFEFIKIKLVLFWGNSFQTFDSVLYLIVILYVTKLFHL